MDPEDICVSSNISDQHAYQQSDQSLHWPHQASILQLGGMTNQTVQMHRLISLQGYKYLKAVYTLSINRLLS